MIIIHCITKTNWESAKLEKVYGKEQLESYGFIHCSSIDYFWRVAPNFLGVCEEMILLCIDTDRVVAEIKWEDGDNCGRKYPHVYGELNIDAVIDVVAFNRNNKSQFIMNPELSIYQYTGLNFESI